MRIIDVEEDRGSFFCFYCTRTVQYLVPLLFKGRHAHETVIFVQCIDTPTTTTNRKYVDSLFYWYPYYTRLAS